MSNINKTLEYYNENAKNFVSGTVSVEFESMQKKFTDKLEEGSYILDFGCGSGRDTKYFKEHGFKVDAIDGSIELCKIATEFSGVEVKNMFFEDLDEENKYDGIWACASILHVEKKNLNDIFKKMTRALKDNGVLYTSFKYGDFEGDRNGRFFTFLDEKSFREIISDIKELNIEEEWVTTDVRPGRGEERWLNIILRVKK